MRGTGDGTLTGALRPEGRRGRETRPAGTTTEYADGFARSRSGTGPRTPAGPRSAAGLRTAAGSPTALRERTDDYWNNPNGYRSRTATGSRGGSGNGRGPGGGGRRGGRQDGRRPATTAGQRFKRWLLYGSWWRHWTWRKAAGVAACGVAALFVLGVVGFFILYKMTPIPTADSLTANFQSSTVTFADGAPLGTFEANVDGQVVERELLTSQQIPQIMTEAMTAAEDRHFYTEGGVSITGLIRAAIDDVRGDGNLQGASTITMQYAKLHYSNVDTGRNVTTKLKEIFIATKLSHERSKTWVMTNYLNTVPFAPTIYGLGAAAENYFNIDLTKPGSTLTISQAAMLAALPNAPGVLNPDPSAGAGYTALVARWRSVLANMVKDGNITEAQAKAQVFPKLTPPPSGNGETGYTGYLMSMVQQQLEAPKSMGGYGLTLHQIETGGYRITTTFDMAEVDALAAAVNKEKAAMEEASKEGNGSPFQDYDRLGAVLENPKTGAIVAVYGGPGYGSADCSATNCYLNMAEAAEPVGSSFKTYVLSAAVNEGMNVFTSQLDGYSPIWIPEKSPSLSETETTPSLTSPPKGVSANAPGGYSGSVYYFKFDEAGENSGKPLPVNVAAAISSDPAFEDLVHRVGIDATINMAQAFGVGQSPFVLPCQYPGSDDGDIAATVADCNDMTGPGFTIGKTAYLGNGMRPTFSPTAKNSQAAVNAGLPGSPAIALGENPLTPVEQATTFATLADDGLYHQPFVVSSVYQGNTLVPSNLPAPRQVLSKAAAADVDYALSFDNNMAGGTADGNVSFRRGGVIGKTGTLGSGSVASEAWFIGATPDQDALSVALFTANPATENLDNLPEVGGTPGSQGGGWPASIWNAFMTAQFGRTPADPMFPTVNDSSFAAWIQAQPPKPKVTTCKNGAFTNCTCATGDVTCTVCQHFGQACNANNNATTNNGNNGNGNNGSSPNPAQTCATEVLGRCVGATPGPSAGPVTPAPTNTTTSVLISGTSSQSSAVTLLAFALPAADPEPAVRLGQAVAV